MSLSRVEQRVLERIGTDLAEDDPRLAVLLSARPGEAGGGWQRHPRRCVSAMVAALVVFVAMVGVGSSLADSGAGGVLVMTGAFGLCVLFDVAVGWGYRCGWLGRRR